MTMAFYAVFAFALVVNIIATLRSSYPHIFGHKAIRDDESDANDSSISHTSRSKNEEIIKRYLPVYILAVFSDWVKGPYGYELYSSSDCYDYSSHETYILCSVIPFLSSMVFGTLLCGPIADYGLDLRREGGRRYMVLVFTVVTILSNITKHFRNFKISVVGAILEGISTSLLFTGFDSWLVGSLPSNASLQLSRALASAEYRNNIAAICASWIATRTIGMTELRPLFETSKVFHVGGVLNPFDLSSVTLLLCAVSIHVFWDERQGEKEEMEKEKNLNERVNGSTWWQRYQSSITDSYVTIVNSMEILFIGVICSLFEAAMFIFVFSWTNAVASRLEVQQEIPFDLIFATFMFGCMTGTSVFTVLIDEMNLKNETIGKGGFFVAMGSFIGMALANSIFSSMMAFFLFELSVGVYFPMMGTMKSQVVPEKHRATIYNVYRIPFNAIMIIFLFWSSFPSSSLSLYPKLPFAICACMVGAALGLQNTICKHQERRLANSPPASKRINKMQFFKSNDSDQDAAIAKQKKFS